MKTISFLGFALVTCLAGCASSSDGDGVDADGAEEGALSTAERLLSGVVAVEMDVTPLPREAGREIKTTIAVPATVKKLIKLKKTRESAPSSAACSSTATNLRFFDAKGEQIAKSQLVCNIGVLDLPRTATMGVKLDESLDLHAIAAADHAPIDALWRVTSVTVKRRSTNAEAETTDAEKIKKLVDALEGEKAIDPRASLPRCRGDVSVTFERDGKPVALSSFSCGVGPGASERVNARFAMLDKDGETEVTGGAVSLDPRPFAALVDE